MNEANGGTISEDDDFFGDQSNDRQTESEIRTREVEVLRRQHMTTGIREGVSDAREAHLQEGFDEGFERGAKSAAEPGFLLGACSLFEAFLGKGTSNSRIPKSKILGDTEIPSLDMERIKQAASQLRQELRSLPEDGSVTALKQARDACQHVAVIEVPSSLAEK